MVNPQWKTPVLTPHWQSCSAMLYPLKIHWIDPITFARLIEPGNLCRRNIWSLNCSPSSWKYIYEDIRVQMYCHSDSPASLMCTQACVCIFFSPDSGGIYEAVCEASVLKLSRAERSCCCVWGSKPAARIVCNGRRGWDFVFSTVSDTSDSAKNICLGLSLASKP